MADRQKIVRFGRRALIGGGALALVGLYAVKMSALIVPPARADCDDYLGDGLPEVVLYGASWCGFCTKTRWFLEDRGVAYCEYDIDTSVRGGAEYRTMNTIALPVVMIDGRRVDGFDVTRLEDALRARDLL